MKSVFKFFAYVIFLFVLAIVVLNRSNAITLETNFLSIRTGVGFLILVCSVLSSIGTVFLGIANGWFSFTRR